MFGKHLLFRAHTLVTAFMATLLLVSAGCRSAPRADHPAGKDPYLIGSEELEASVRSTLYDAIWELRPRWLTRTARQTRTEPYVYVDDQVLGTAGALAILLFLPEHWPVVTPLICVACFGAWGLAAKQTQVLDLLHRRAPALRFWLRIARTAAASVGVASAAIGMVELFVRLIRPASLL